MQSTVPRPQALLSRVIEDKPYHEAADALSAVQSAVVFAINDHYDGNQPPRFPAERASIAMCLIPVPVAGAVLLASDGLMLLAAGLALTVPLLLLTPVAYMFHKMKPEVHFRDACKKLASAASEMPQATRARLSEFVRKTKEVFILAKVSVIQEELAAGVNLSVRRLHKLERKGLALADEAATTLRMTYLERGRLQAAFRAGTLPTPQHYVDSLNKDCWTALAAVEAARANPARYAAGASRAMRA